MTAGPPTVPSPPRASNSSLCGRCSDAGALIVALTAALPALTTNLALELAPIRVNLIAAGFVDTPLFAKSIERHALRRGELVTA